MGIAAALLVAGLAFVVVKKMSNRKKQRISYQQMGGMPPGYGGGGWPQQGGYRDMMGAATGGMGGGGAGGYGAPPAYSQYGGGSGGGAADSYYGGGGSGKRDMTDNGNNYGNGNGQYGGGQYGQQQQQSPPGPSYQEVLNTLNKCIQEQRIGAFYRDPRAIDAIAQRIVASDAVMEIAEEWRLTPDIAIDLCKLALFDIVVLVDDSAAMRWEQGGERMNDVKETLAKVAYAATLFDDDGIEVRFLNAPIDGNRINSDDAAVNLLSRINYDGPCALGSALDYKVLQPLILQPARSGMLHKPKLIIVITGGTGAQQSEAPGTLQQVIGRAADELQHNTPYGADALSFQFCQIGNDKQAEHWLSSIDADPTIGRLMDQTGDFDAEAAEMMRKTGQQLTPVMWLLKMMLGGIDDSYDSKDE